MNLPMLTFYKKHGVSPVRQDLKNLTQHFDRRSALYFTLGLLPSAIRGRRVLEVGPGSGHNAIYTATLAPACYDLLEANPAGVKDIKKTFRTYTQLPVKPKVINQSLGQFCRSKPASYDVVICEGVLGGFSKPLSAIRQLITLMNPGALLVVTTCDPVSILAETVRRICAYQLFDPTWSQEEQVKALLPCLTPHLDTLAGMSRRYDDWIVDNILLPLSGGYNVVSMAEVVEALPKGFHPLGSSPRIFRDFRWYKDIRGKDRQFKTSFHTSYWESLHNLLDYRCVLAPQSIEKNKRIFARCDEFRMLVLAYERNHQEKIIQECVRVLSVLERELAPFAKEASASVGEARTFLSNRNRTPKEFARAKSLRSFFGRGMQYLSIFRDEKRLVPSQG